MILSILRCSGSFLLKVKCKNLKKINLLPYHKIGSSKYKKFKIPYRMNGVEPPSPARMKELKQYFEETGIKVKIGGLNLSPSDFRSQGEV